MRMADVVGYDAGVALVEHRCGLLPDLNLSDAFLHYADIPHHQEIYFKDGSRLRRDWGSSIYQVLSPSGHVLTAG